MQATIISCNKNDKSDKLFINNSNFLDNYFSNNNVKIANINNTMILYIFFASKSNGFSNFGIMS